MGVVQELVTRSWLQWMWSLQAQRVRTMLHMSLSELTEALELAQMADLARGSCPSSNGRLCMQRPCTLYCWGAAFCILGSDGYRRADGVLHRHGKAGIISELLPAQVPAVSSSCS